MVDDAQSILKDLGTDYYKMELLEYPVKIVNQKAKLRELRNALKDVENSRALREAEIYNSIVEKKNPDTGKPMYSNDTLRNNAKLQELAIDSEYQNYLKQFKQAEMAVEQAQDELEMLENKYRSCRYIVALATEEVSLFAGEKSLHALEGRLEMILGKKEPLKRAQAY